MILRNRYPKSIIYIQPPIDDCYNKGVDMTYEDLAPSTGLAILSCETERRSISEICSEVYIAPELNYKFYMYCAQFDLVALSSWFTNYINCLHISKNVKRIKPSIDVVIGGQNASNLGKRILLN